MNSYVQTIDGEVLRGPVRVVRRRSASLGSVRGVRGLGDGFSTDDSGNLITDNSGDFLQDSTPLWSNTTSAPSSSPIVLNTPASNGSGNTELNSILNTAAQTLSKIFTAQYAVPPPGTVITTPQGSIYRASNGSPVSLPTSLTSLSTSGLLPWILIGGVGLFVVAKMIGGKN